MSPLLPGRECRPGSFCTLDTHDFEQLISSTKSTALIPMILATPALAGVTIAALGGIAVEVVLGKSKR